MIKKDILVISNDKLFIKKNLISSRYNDTVNIIEALSSNYNLSFIARKSKINQKFSVKVYDQKHFKFLDLFNVNQSKVFMVSITPFNFLYFLVIKLLNKKINGYVYLRSDGHKEYSYKLGILGFWIYNFMFNYLNSHLQTISVSKNITGIKKPYFLIKPSEIDSIWLKKKKKPKLDKPRLLYLGRFKAEKGIFSLINLIKSFKTDTLTLNIVGIKKKINPKGSKIRFYKETSSQKKIINYYDNSNIFILPSFTEGSPKVILESLSRQRPVIIFSEIQHVKSKFRGVYSCNRNSRDLRKLINYIMKNYHKIQKLLKKNKIFTKKKFQKKLNEIIL